MQSELRNLFVCIILSFNIRRTFSACNVETQLFPIVKKWAPEVWLHSGESYFPMAVPKFLEHIELRDQQGNANGYLLSDQPTGSASNNIFFTTKEDKQDLMADTSSWLHGEIPSVNKVPIYAKVEQCDDDCKVLVITYWFFYPFNEGKLLCNNPSAQLMRALTFGTVKLCFVGQRRYFGHHVGDWEHVSLKIRDGQPSIMYMSVHDGGVVYNYDFRDHKGFYLSKLLTTSIQAPAKHQVADFIPLNADGHPIMYIAKGSHAMWGSTGQHGYTKFIALIDLTEKTYIWKTWETVEIFHSKETTPWWFEFNGHWGNGKDMCIPLAPETFCVFTNGPKGLSQRAPEDRFTCDK